MKHKLIAFTLPYPAQIIEGVLVIAMPIAETGPLFTEEAIQSTYNALGKREGNEALEETADCYYSNLSLRQMKPAGVPHAETPRGQNGLDALQRAFDEAGKEEKAYVNEIIPKR